MISRPYEIKDNQTGEIVLVEGSTPASALLAFTRERFVVTTPSASRVAELFRKTDVRFIAKEAVSGIAAEIANINSPV